MISIRVRLGGGGASLKSCIYNVGYDYHFDSFLFINSFLFSNEKKIQKITK